jgi:bifunctional ADP-heptose synthase (sugar kinase/adenylyltransferase)
MSFEESHYPLPNPEIQTQETPKTEFIRPPKPAITETIKRVANGEAIDELRMEKVLPQLKEALDQGKSIVITNGHFVLTHLGHLATFSEAREAGTSLREDKNEDGVILLVLVNNDEQSRLKDSKNAQLQNATERGAFVLFQAPVDFAVVSEAPQGDTSLVSDFQRLVQAGISGPNIVYVKGSDYNADQNVPPEARIIQDAGGKFAVVDRIGTYSTSGLKQGLNT